MSQRKSVSQGVVRARSAGAVVLVLENYLLINRAVWPQLASPQPRTEDGHSPIIALRASQSTMTKQGLRVSTRRTSVTGPKVLTRAAIARGSRGGGIAVLCANPQPRKRNRQPKKRKRQPTEHAADEDAADEVRTPDWEARGAHLDQGRGSRDVVDHFDVPDVKDVQAVVPYVREIYRYYRETEGLKHASPSYMSKHADINAKMRAILIDWLVEVHLKFKLLPETLYLTVNLIDRFLEKEHTIMRDKLQLVGVTAMFLASKYEEIYHPECRDFAFISAQVA